MSRNKGTTVGRLATELRERVNLSQQELADAVGVSLATVQNVERDQPVRAETMHKIYREVIRPPGHGPKTVADDDEWAHLVALWVYRAFGTVVQPDALKKILEKAERGEETAQDERFRRLATRFATFTESEQETIVRFLGFASTNRKLVETMDSIIRAFTE